MSIFPALNRDIDSQIIGQIIICRDNYSLLNLSGVNKAANKELSNALFFKKLYIMQHPQLAEIKNTFQILCATHPSNCWKVVCCAFSKDYLQGNTTFKFNATFLREAVSIISNYLNSEKSQLDSQMRNLCGDYYEDPNSSLDKAWKASKKNEEQLAICKSSHFEHVSKPLLPIHSPEEVETIIQVLSGIAVMISSTAVDDALASVLDEMDSCLKSEYLPVYQLVIGLIQERYREMDAISQRARKFQRIFVRLLLEKAKCEFLLSGVNHKLTLMDPADPRFISDHTSDLITLEFANAKMINDHLVDSPKITECIRMIDSVLIAEDVSPEDYDQIKHLINSSAEAHKTYVWGELYRLHANGVQEDQWSEKHFHEFLPQLKQILSSAMELCQEFIETAKQSEGERTLF